MAARGGEEGTGPRSRSPGGGSSSQGPRRRRPNFPSESPHPALATPPGRRSAGPAPFPSGRAAIGRLGRPSEEPAERSGAAGYQSAGRVGEGEATPPSLPLHWSPTAPLIPISQWEVELACQLRRCRCSSRPPTALLPFHWQRRLPLRKASEPPLEGDRRLHSPLPTRPPSHWTAHPPLPQIDQPSRRSESEGNRAGRGEKTPSRDSPSWMPINSPCQPIGCFGLSPALPGHSPVTVEPRVDAHATDGSPRGEAPGPGRPPRPPGDPPAPKPRPRQSP